MAVKYNLYCDESCHLENDHQTAMVLGAVWCPKDSAQEILTRIREIKTQYGLSPWTEIKWTKISPKKLPMYLHLVDYFFDSPDLHFRGLVVPNKMALDHQKFEMSHDDFYYRMYFTMIKAVLSPQDTYDIYIDIKDTRGGAKVKQLHKVLGRNMYDFNSRIVQNMQIIRSEEVGIMQLADLLIGAVSHLNRGIKSSEAKQRVIERIQERSKYSLTKSTLPSEDKFNLFVWHSEG
ncbi:MAG TPA: DUF3800 domain-containing protein [Candidatus Paceibacterota bacterium]|nr:DUF3800 domain-containing protein [Candidatus Paceibacterota bacterium]